MKAGKSEVIIILDRSGSMSSIKADMEGGLKAFVDKQAKEPGECLVSLYQFDTDYEAVFEALDVKAVGPITLVPRGSTALRDAIGKTIAAVGERLSKTPESERPSLVIVVVLTDGEENASKEYTQPRIAEMVKHQQEAYSWQFRFLGANQDAVLAAANHGIMRGSSLTYAATSGGVAATMSILSSGLSCMRTDINQFGHLCATTDYSFTDTQRKDALAGTPPTP